MSLALMPMRSDEAMTVTEIRFHGAKNKNFLAYVSVVLGGCLKLNDIRLITSSRDPGRKIIIMPERTDPSGNRIEVYHPIRPDFRGTIEAAIFAAWDKRVDPC